MKKSILIIIGCLLLSYSSIAGDTLSLSISGKYLVQADDNFKEVYGNSVFIPEIKADINVLKNLYLWVGFGMSTSIGTTFPDLNEDIEFKQNIISGGIGYRIRVSKKTYFLLEAGTAYFNCKETAFDMEVKSSALGYRIAGGLNLYLGKIVFAQLSGGYMSATDDAAGEEVKLGGAFASFGLGFQF